MENVRSRSDGIAALEKFQPGFLRSGDETQRQGLIAAHIAVEAGFELRWRNFVTDLKGFGGFAVRVAGFHGQLVGFDEQRLFQQTAERFGRLDILVNSAANFIPAGLDETTEKIWDDALNTNLKAPFFCAQAAAPLLKKSCGVIVNFADIGGILPWTGYIPHCASKAGVIMLTKCLAKALAPEVRVNAIAPGTITMSRDPSEWEADFIRRAPLHRAGTTEDVAEAVSYLIRAKFMTGHVLVLDGGRTL